MRDSRVPRSPEWVSSHIHEAFVLCGAIPIVKTSNGMPAYSAIFGAFPYVDAAKPNWLEQVRKLMTDDAYYRSYIERWSRRAERAATSPDGLRWAAGTRGGIKSGPQLWRELTVGRRLDSHRSTSAKAAFFHCQFFGASLHGPRPTDEHTRVTSWKPCVTSNEFTPSRA